MAIFPRGEKLARPGPMTHLNGRRTSLREPMPPACGSWWKSLLTGIFVLVGYGLGLFFGGVTENLPRSL